MKENKMGVFNNWDYNAEEEAAKRKAIMEEFLGSDETHLLMLDKEKPTVKIEHTPGFYSADCPNCGKTKVLSSELNSMSAVCNKCYCVFNLEK